jgi:hypothetical protein
MKIIYLTITNLEFLNMSPEEVEIKVMEIMQAFSDYMGDRTQAIATDHPHNVIMEDLKKYGAPIAPKEVRDQ